MLRLVLPRAFWRLLVGDWQNEFVKGSDKLKSTNKVLHKLYPEARLTGFSRNDYVVTFWSQVNAVLRPEMTVLDFGAGRGKWAEETVDFRRELLQLKGRCARVAEAPKFE